MLSTSAFILFPKLQYMHHLCSSVLKLIITIIMAEQIKLSLKKLFTHFSLKKFDNSCLKFQNGNVHIPLKKLFTLAVVLNNS